LPCPLSAVERALPAARDTSERKRAEQQQSLLTGEIKHRVKNTLSIVQAIASQTLCSTSPQECQAFLARIHALAGAHDVITQDHWASAPLRDVIHLSLEPFDSRRFLVDGPEVAVEAKQSFLVTLAMHELATNAVKYGALSNGTGQVRVDWTVLDDKVRRRWHETGGPPVRSPHKRGSGSFLIERALDGQGEAAITFAPDGVVCTIQIAVGQ
jgi:two-component sensor histidine kinase